MLQNVCKPPPGDAMADGESVAPAEDLDANQRYTSQDDVNWVTRCTSREIEIKAQEFQARHSTTCAQTQANQRASLVTDILFGSGRLKGDATKGGQSPKAASQGGHGKKKGAFGGVFVPTCENMWGVLIFLRFYTVVGQAGVAQALCVVWLSFSAAFCTVSSMSAIASSGGMQGQGGPYYMISRALGPCVGASVGIMYWLAITMLAVLECLGAVEGILMAAPSAWFSGCVQAYGSALMMALAFSVYLGINFVHKLGIFFVFVVFFTLFSYYYGLFTAPATDAAQGNWMITGLSSETFLNNWNSHYTDDFHFGTALSIFFPCFTGILSGANRADILKDPPKNIRQGTFGAILFSLFMYSSFMILWGCVANYQYLQGTQHLPDPDDGAGRRLAGGGEGAYIVEEVVWNPFPHAAHLGIIISSLSQALQCLIVAPRLLQSIAKDKILGALQPLAPLSRNGEPARALGASYIVAGLLVLIGSLDMVAPLLSMCFLVCYTFMNISCFCLTWLRSPQWRPEGIQKRRWRVWYLGTGSCGFVICLSIMFTIDPIWAAGALGLASSLYVYMNWQIEKKEWGSSFDGIRFQLALDSLTSLEKAQHQAVNWRPQVLILYRVKVSDELKGIQHHEILRFYSMLLGKKRNGFCVVACVLDGDRRDHSTLHKAQSEKTIISTIMQQEGIKGFAEVVVAPSWGEGSNYVIQLTGIGGLVPNTVLLDWPEGGSTRPDKAVDFVETVGTALAERKAVLALKGGALMPTQEVIGTIDVWWMIHDGGFMVLLGWLLVQHRVWRDCKVRVFTVTVGIDSDQAKQAAAALTTLLKRQRLVNVDVEVIVVDGGMQPFTQDGAVRAEERREFLEKAQPSVAGGGCMEKSIPMEVDDLFEQPRAPCHDDSMAPSAGPRTAVNGLAHRAEEPVQAIEDDAIESLKETIYTRSRRAQLVVMNMPDVWSSKPKDACNYIFYCDTITQGLDRVLFVHSSGHEIFDLHADRI